eukprot:GSMAST32.ASY1.ANO1.2150.1 assembled CDS
MTIIILDLAKVCMYMLQNTEQSTILYKQILRVDVCFHDTFQKKTISLFLQYFFTIYAACIESISCLATNHFYSDQPEVALFYYRRLVQMNVNNAEIWNNLGLCCFYAAQYDMSLGCFQRALSMANDENVRFFFQIFFSYRNFFQNFFFFQLFFHIKSFSIN